MHRLCSEAHLRDVCFEFVFRYGSRLILDDDGGIGITCLDPLHALLLAEQGFKANGACNASESLDAISGGFAIACFQCSEYRKTSGSCNRHELNEFSAQHLNSPEVVGLFGGR